MEQVNLFNDEFKNIRMELVDDEPWYVFEDVIRELDIETEFMINNYYGENNSLFNKLPENTKGFLLIDSTYYRNRILTINRKGIYILLFMSNLENKRLNQFNNWIASKVIPSIIETGTYTDNENIMENFKLINN